MKTRSIVFIILLVTLIAIFLSTYFAKDSYKLIPVNTNLNENPLPLSESWFPYDSPDGNFNVSLPLLPQTATQNIVDPKTDESRRYEMYVAQTDSGLIYMISSITIDKDIDTADQKALLKKMMDDMVSAKAENKLKSSSEGVFQGMPSLDFIIENDINSIEAKEFFSGRTIYLLSIISKKGSKENTHYDYFINSFKLKQPTATK